KYINRVSTQTGPNRPLQAPTGPNKLQQAHRATADTNRHQQTSTGPYRPKQVPYKPLQAPTDHNRPQQVHFTHLYLYFYHMTLYRVCVCVSRRLLMCLVPMLLLPFPLCMKQFKDVHHTCPCCREVLHVEQKRCCQCRT
uniref:LITAF domain-containing protein n=1 Tax=Cyclopterus lumpus TaxID=8103 RepID=A0A8C2XDB3_CYCLU